MPFRRMRRFLFLVLAGGFVFQTTTTSCQTLVAELGTQLITTAILNAVLGVLTGGTTT